jgi:sugar-specific transcriptional regulator TrmB
MAKIVVIDVDLGINVEELIANNAKELTDLAKQELDEAIAVAESAKKLQAEKTAKAKSTVDGIQRVLDESYEMLESAKEEGVAVDKIILHVKEFIPNSSAFTIRMNNILSARDNPYRLILAL